MVKENPLWTFLATLFIKENAAVVWTQTLWLIFLFIHAFTHSFIHQSICTWHCSSCYNISSENRFLFSWNSSIEINIEDTLKEAISDSIKCYEEYKTVME